MSVALVLVGGVTRVVTYQVIADPEHKISRLLNRLDLGHEPSLPNWWSSLLWLGCAGLALVCSRGPTNAKESRRRPFQLLALLFVVLAIDEAVMIHELADATLHEMLNTSGLLYFAWVIPGAIFVVCIVLLFGKFVLGLPGLTRNKLILAGVVFVSGAIGCELFEGALYESNQLESVSFTLLQCVEELLEMLGVILCADALLTLIAGQQLRVVVDS